MPPIKIQVQLSPSVFKTIELNSQMPVSKVIPELIRHLMGEIPSSSQSGYKVLFARQITSSGETTLEQLDIKPGDYLLIAPISIASVKLALLPENRFNHNGWVIDQQEVLIGRRDDASGIRPDIDLTPFSGDPLTISRQLAYLREKEGVWSIQLHKDGHSGLYIDQKKLEQGQNVELHDKSILAFGTNSSNPEFYLGIKILSE